MDHRPVRLITASYLGKLQYLLHIITICDPFHPIMAIVVAKKCHKNETFLLHERNDTIGRGDCFMIFRSKVDTFFISTISIIILILSAIILLPPLMDGKAPMSLIRTSFAIFLMITGFILWATFCIRYIFYDDYLLVKGGPFRSKIPYQAITKIAPTKEIFTGYRILSSKDALELFYKSALLGSVKISPKNKGEFITELKKRCPHVEIKE